MFTTPFSAWLLTACMSLGGEPVLTFERTFVDLGPASDEQVIRQPFKFTYTGPRWTRLRFDNCHFCPTPQTDQPDGRYQPGQSGLVILELPTMGKHGDTEITSTVYADIDPANKVELRLKASVRPRIMIRSDTDDLAEFARAAGGEVTIQVLGRQPGFEVTKVSTESPFVQARIGEALDVADLGDTCRASPVHLRILPGAPVGPLHATVELTTNDTTRPTLSPTVQVMILGDLAVTPESLSLGTFDPRAVFTGTILLTRRDGAALRLGDVRFAAEPGLGVRDLVVDCTPSEDLGSLRITVTGRAPEFATNIAQSFLTISIEDEQGHAVDQVRVPIRITVRSTQPFR